ncbi:MAG: hypothetical protein RLZZ301_1230 [Bacteroidota bacterium]|jgi:glycosyltransferase involved in cell wall biosynthesis
MKILVVSHKAPFPIVDGGCKAMARMLLDLLQTPGLECLDYFVFSTAKHPFDAAAFPSDPRLHLHSFELDTSLVWHQALRHLLKGRSYNLVRFQNNRILQNLQRMLSHNGYDFVVFESLFAAIYAAPLRSYSTAAFLYRAHNIEYRIWKDLAKNEKNPLKKWYLRQLAHTLKWEERRIWSEEQGALNLIVPISLQDTQDMEAQTLTPLAFIPASIPTSQFSSTLNTKRLCFIGAFDWKPNIEAVEWFLNDVFPALLKQDPTLEFHIAGRDSKKQNWQQLPQVVVHGFVPDSDQFIATHGLFVGAMQSGSGVKMKILEAFSVGAPLVLSPKAADGLQDIPAAYLQQDAAQFTEEISRLLRDKSALEERANWGKTYLQTHFSPSAIQTDLQRIMAELQNNG